MSQPSPTDQASETARVREMLWGFRATCLAAAAVEIGLVDRLAASAASEAELARVLGAHPTALHRFLRALEALGLLERREGLVALGPGGRGLLELRDFARLIGAEYLPAWAQIGHTIRTGETAFDRVFGMSVWKHREEHPALNESLNRTMLTYQRGQIGAILGAWDFSAARLLVDVGGGQGAVLAAILARHPALEAILFDQPHVVEGAASQLAATGVSSRCRTVGGSFFESVPPGGDTYVLKHILHNWDDDSCTRILRACREAMPATSTLLVIENVLPAEGPAGTKDSPHWDVFMLDMHMMAVLGGRVRTLAQFDALFESVGLRRARCLDAQGVVHVIEVHATERGLEPGEA